MKSSSSRNPAPVPVQDTQQARDQRHATQLLNASMTYARLILRRYGEIAPFGFSMDREGQIARETLDIPRLPRDPQSLWKLLNKHIAGRIGRGAIQAFAMGANVALAEASAEGYADAIVLSIEQESGHAMQVTVPYRIYGGQFGNILPRRIALGKMVAEESTARLFIGGDSGLRAGF